MSTSIQQRANGDRAAAATGQKPTSGNILCVANFASDTGYAWRLMERFWLQLGNLAHAQDGEVIVAFPKVNGIPVQLRDASVRVVELTVPTSLPAPLLALRRFIRDNRIHTMYFTDRHYWSPLYALFRSWGVTSIIVHDHIPGERPTPPAWKLLVKRLRHSVPGCSADLYIGVSEFVYHRLIQSGGVPAARCTYVRNGVAITPRERSDIRVQFGIPADARVIVSSGRLTFYKGIDFIIQCAARLTRDDAHADVYFVHLGDGPHRHVFERTVRELGLEGRFIFAGVRSDVPALLPSCTVALHASHGEAFSLAILEFMAAGLPAIVPDHCGNGEAIEHEVSGVRYRPGDLDQAVTWLRRLLDDVALRRRFGAAAQSRAHEEFSLGQMDRTFAALVRPFIRT